MMFSKKFIFCFVAISSALLAGAPVLCSIQRQCLQTYQKECVTFFKGKEVAPSESLQHSIFPNARNLSLVDALGEFNDFYRLLSLNNYCSYLLHSFLCIHYFSPCDPTRSNGEVFVVPCRAVCEEATVECRLDYVYDHLDISRPQHLNCANFPVESSESGDVIVACPSPAVRLDFSPPFGEKAYRVSEQDEYLEVCIRLASTGSHEELLSSVEVIVTYEDQSATGGEDYNTSIDRILFTSGSTKDDRHCFNITIADDLLVEGNETFSINVQGQAEDIPNPTSGSGHVSGSGQETLSVAVNVGGALNSSTGSISVTIVGNDVCSIPSKYCEGKCRQRQNAGKNTFRDNDYTYAAHIELLGIMDYDTCTAVNARIIQCWEIKPNTCPPVNTSLTIPTCDGCPKLRPLNVGDHYLIAGVHHNRNGKRRIVLPGSIEIGLFGAWDDNNYTHIADWVQRGIHAIRVDFSLPTGEKGYTVSEQDEYLEVCIRLASTGSHKRLLSPVEVIVTFKNKSATDGEDYTKSHDPIKFPSGSAKGDHRCFNITIADDLLIEENEEFSIKAHVYENDCGTGSDSKQENCGPGSSNVRGALSSTTGSISVTITDNDECFMHQRVCESKCRQRSNAGENTFHDNNYTYAAHIELLGIMDYETCTAVNARIIQCWEIKAKTCPPVNTFLTIPTCASCPILQPLDTGNRYLIAGVQRKINGVKRIILPSKKKTGLFSHWDDNEYADIPTWVQSGISNVRP